MTNEARCAYLTAGLGVGSAILHPEQPASWLIFTSAILWIVFIVRLSRGDEK